MEENEAWEYSAQYIEIFVFSDAFIDDCSEFVTWIAWELVIVEEDQVLVIDVLEEDYHEESAYEVFKVNVLDWTVSEFKLPPVFLRVNTRLEVIMNQIRNSNKFAR